MFDAVLVGVLLDDDAVLLVSVCQTTACQVVALGLGRLAVFDGTDTRGAYLCKLPGVNVEIGCSGDNEIDVVLHSL